ncbi:alpha/beta fold hydrolase [Streptomyces sp. NPDC094032]|uniref:alpha/beta fold hydrolase n=1 Tax=Streptomyces sp. NPDC094032 TaxID=3155308 RepID=UPI0033291558
MNDTALWHTEHGDGTPIVLIHGYTIDHRLLLPLEPAFTGRPGWRRLYPDLPGHGNSPRLSGPTSAATMTEAVVDWIRTTVGDQPFAVLGQSFGGQIARAVTARFGEQVLGSALLVPVVRWGAARTLPDSTVGTVAERDDALLDRLAHEEDLGLFRNVMARHTEESWALFQEHIVPGWRAHDRTAAAELDKDFLLPHWPEHLGAPHQGRHLLLTARQDALVGWHDQLALLDHYPRMTAVVLDGAGHNPQVECAPTVRGLIGDWLDTLEHPRAVTATRG